MKTLNLHLRNLSGRFSTLLLIASAFLAGCQKDRIQPANGQDIHYSDVKRTSSTYSIMVIDHDNKGKDNLPSYRVELFSDGRVLFEGRENTIFLGETKSLISKDQIQKINDLFKVNEFSSIEVLSFSEELPTVTTYFNTSRGGKTEIRVDNLEQPDKLVALRQTAEDVLEIGQLINQE